MYCSQALALSEEQRAAARPAIKPLESWEQGINVILLPNESSTKGEGGGEDKRKQIADLLRLSIEDVNAIADAGVPLPLARVSSAEEGNLIEQRLTSSGFRTASIPDSDLISEKAAPHQVRSAQLGESELSVVASRSHSVERLAWNRIVLFVAGRRTIRHLEVVERRAKRDEKEFVDSREMSEDESWIDIYTDSPNYGWRISAANFDFSCLGEKKKLIATQNFETLVAVLRERATNAIHDLSYERVRRSLSLVWPIEQRTESRGIRKLGIRQLATQAATISDNESQFTRYSRLRHLICLRSETGR